MKKLFVITGIVLPIFSYSQTVESFSRWEMGVLRGKEINNMVTLDPTDLQSMVPHEYRVNTADTSYNFFGTNNRYTLDNFTQVQVMYKLGKGASEKRWISHVGLNAGFGSFYGGNLISEKDVRFRKDTLTSQQTGTNYYIDSTQSDRYNTTYDAYTFQLGMRYHVEREIGKRSRIGIGAQFIWSTSYANEAKATFIQRYTISEPISEQDYNHEMSGLYFSSYGTRDVGETELSYTGKGPTINRFMVQVPFFYAFQIGKKREWLKPFYVKLETTLGGSYIQIGDYAKVFRASGNLMYGLSYRF